MDHPVDVGRDLGADRTPSAEESDERASAERLHSRGTFITRAAMGLGVGLFAAVGAAAAPARASVAARTRSRARRVSRLRSAQATDSTADFVVQGTSSFSDVVNFARSGIASIGAGHNSATVTGETLTTASLVFATIQNQVAGSNQESGAGLSVQAVVPNVAAGSFTIFVSQRVPYRQTLQVGWFIAN